MKTTIGKRIMENRKRLKLTQDALAEQLGVTAQAVSKWENDQSCPDISILPQLSDIFGITTDELLGKEPKIFVAEIVEQPNIGNYEEADAEEDEEDEEDDAEESAGKWELTWESGKKGSIIFAFGVLLYGGLLLAGRILGWEASWWDILWPVALLMVGFETMIPKFSFFGLGATIFGGYFLVANLGIWQLSFANELILPVIVVIFGLSLLADAFRKPNKPHIKVTRDGKTVNMNKEDLFESSYNAENSEFSCSVTFGHENRQVLLDVLSAGEIECEFGELEVDLTQVQAVTDGCTINSDCSFGRIKLLVPSRFRVETDNDSTFGKLHILGKPDEAPSGVIRLKADTDFGNITVKYI